MTGPRCRVRRRSRQRPRPQRHQALRADLEEQDDHDEHHQLGEAGAGHGFHETVEHSQAEGDRYRTAELTEAAGDDHEEGVDDVRRAQGRPEIGPTSVIATPATPARPDPMKNVSWSTRAVSAPLTAASCRFCTTARIRRPCRVRLRYRSTANTQPSASANMNSRGYGNRTPARVRLPSNQAGRVTL